MPEDCASLRLRLLFEYTRFLDWGDAAGLSDAAEHDRFDITLKASRPMIFAALSEMRVRLERLTKIRGSFKELLTVDDALTGGRDTIDLHVRDSVTEAELNSFGPVFASQDVIIPETQRPKGISVMIRAWQSTKEVATHPKRLKWAMVDKEKFEENLQKIKELTDFLHEMLGDSKMDKLLEQSRETGLGIMQLHTGQRELRELLMAATLVPRFDKDDTSSVISQATTLANERHAASIPAPLHGSDTTFEQLTKFRLQYSVIQSQSRAAPSTELSFERLELSAKPYTPTVSEDHDVPDSTRGVSVTDDFLSTRVFGRLVSPDSDASTDSQVWVEWKQYDEIITSTTDLKSIKGPADATRQQVERLVMLLKSENPPSEFRIPKCVGYCLDEKHTRFGFIYENDFESAAPQTLRQLLSRTPLSLSSRVKTAKDLATSLLFLHAVGWLHKDLCSDNIVFVGQEVLPELPELRLTGFGYARPDEPNLTTQGKFIASSTAVYRHPDYQGLAPKQYRKTFDYYSLGIILMEIALWKPADVAIADHLRSHDLLKPSTGASSIQTRRVRDILLNASNDGSILDQVRLNMGEKYARATKACIVGLDAFGLDPQAKETDPAVNTVLQLEFLHMVVNKLRSISL